MTAKRFENRLNKDDIKFNTQNPVWDNEVNDALNVFEMIDIMNAQHEELENRKQLIKAITNEYNELEQAKNSLLKENKQLKKELFESRCEYIYDTADISDKPYIEEEIEEMRKNIFEKGVYGID